MVAPSNTFWTNTSSPGEAAIQTSNALLHTCQQIYRELKRTPVFYRTNTFVLRTVSELHIFLAALTPRKRATIWNLEVHLLGEELRNDVYWNDLMEFHKVHGRWHHLATLAKECHGLKEFAVVARYKFECPASEPFFLQALKRCQELAKWPPTKPGLWAVPQLKVLLKFGESRDYLDLENPTPDFDRFVFRCWGIQGWRGSFRPVEFVQKDELRSLFDQAHNAMVLRKEQILEEKQQEEKEKMAKKKEEKGAQGTNVNNGTEDLDEGSQVVSDPTLEKALAASGIDFTGEERISRDRLNSTIGPISRRTRSRCNGQVDAIGSIQRPYTRYDKEGLLKPPIVVTGIRSTGVGDEIEVQVKDITTRATRTYDPDLVWKHPQLGRLYSSPGHTNGTEYRTRAGNPIRQGDELPPGEFGMIFYSVWGAASLNPEKERENASAYNTRTWEPLHVLMTMDGMKAIQEFYREEIILGRIPRKDLQARLDGLRRLPMPAMITRLTNDLEILCAKEGKKVDRFSWLFQGFPAQHERRLEILKKRLSPNTWD